MPKFYFDYTNHKGQQASDRQTVPQQIRFGTSQWHKEPQWLMAGWDQDKNAPREYAVQDMTNVRPSFSMYLFSKDTMRNVVTRLEEIVRMGRTKVVEATPQQSVDAVRLAYEALNALGQSGASTPEPEQVERLYLPATMPDDLRDVLGMHPSRAISFSEAARAAGHSIPHKAESEWAFIHWYAINHYLRRNGAPEWQNDLDETFHGFIALAKERQAAVAAVADTIRPGMNKDA